MYTVISMESRWIKLYACEPYWRNVGVSYFALRVVCAYVYVFMFSHSYHVFMLYILIFSNVVDTSSL